MAELLTRKDRGYVHLNHGHRNSRNSVAQHHRGVGIATSIEDDTIVEAISTLNGIDKLALDIRLIVVERNRQ